MLKLNTAAYTILDPLYFHKSLLYIYNSNYYYSYLYLDTLYNALYIYEIESLLLRKLNFQVFVVIETGITWNKTRLNFEA